MVIINCRIIKLLPNFTYPFDRLRTSKVQLILQRIVLPNFHLFAMLELFQQNVSTAFVVVESNRSLKTKKKNKIIIFLAKNKYSDFQYRNSLKAGAPQCLQKYVLPFLNAIFKLRQIILTTIGHILNGQSSCPNTVIGVSVEA